MGLRPFVHRYFTRRNHSKGVMRRGGSSPSRSIRLQCRCLPTGKDGGTVQAWIGDMVNLAHLPRLTRKEHGHFWKGMEDRARCSSPQLCV